MRRYLKRLTNPATIIGITGYVITILSTMGIKIDNEAVMTVVNSVCAICILLGILNNPDTDGLDLPKSDKKLKMDK